MNKALLVENLGFYYQAENFLFQQLNFDLNKGDILAILGQNGCGKSTLLDLLLGIHRPIQGKIEVCINLSVLCRNSFLRLLLILCWISC